MLSLFLAFLTELYREDVVRLLRGLHITLEVSASLRMGAPDSSPSKRPGIIERSRGIPPSASMSMLGGCCCASVDVYSGVVYGSIGVGMLSSLGGNGGGGRGF